MTNQTIEARKECLRLSEFRKFLNSAASAVAAIAADESTVKLCLTRANNETYPVTNEERLPEIIKACRVQLDAKGCPRDFQLKLLRKAVEQIQKEIAHEFGDELDLLKLQKFVTNHLEQIITELADNMAADQLATLSDPGALCADGSQCQCVIGTPAPVYAVGYVKNKPRKMEDRHVCLDRYGALYNALSADSSFYGVFDGHSGTQSATYAATQLPSLLAEELRARPAVDVAHVRAAFENACMLADERLRRKQITSGTTAVCALLYRKHLYVAWVGDSKALLVGTRASLQLVKSHKPNGPEERKRIESAGSSVIFVLGQWRVNGILNVARSIGDYSMDAVIAEPDFVDVELTPAHDFLVLGTDGLWDHVAETDVVEQIYAALGDESCQLENIPKLLIESAKAGGSQDNITAVLVLLKPRADIVHARQKADNNT